MRNTGFTDRTGFSNSWSSAKSSFLRRNPVEGDHINDFQDSSQKDDATLKNLVSSVPYQKWANMANGILRRTYWSRLGDLVKVLTKLPDDVDAIFQRLEADMKIEIDAATRLNYYKSFTRAALGASVVRTDEVSLTPLGLFPTNTSEFIPYIKLFSYRCTLYLITGRGSISPASFGRSCQSTRLANAHHQ